MAHLTRSGMFDPKDPHNQSPKLDKPHALSSQSGTIAALDLGGAKISCFIVKKEDRRESDYSMRISGVGFVQSRGVRAGNIIDIEAASQAIAQAVERAEAMANTALEEIRVVIPGAQCASQTVMAQISLALKPITLDDLNRAIATALGQLRFVNRRPIHLLTIGWSVDEAEDVRDPRGLSGRTLGIKLLVITIDEACFETIVQCVNKAHLTVHAIVSAPLASAISVLEHDERQLGAIVIDMGATTTSVCVFKGGNCIHIDAINIGGAHVTQDLARGLPTRIDAAERLKTLYGSAIASNADGRDLIDVPPLGDADISAPNRIYKEKLKEIIAPRIEETFELILDRLINAGFQIDAGQTIVLTGGAAQLTGVREICVQIFDAPVRIGKPLRVSHLGDAVSGPSFSAVTGAILRSLYGPRDAVSPRAIMHGRLGPRDAPRQAKPPLWRRIYEWLKADLFTD